MNGESAPANGSSDAAYPVIVGVDGSFAAIRAARWASAVAERIDAPLRLVHAADAAQRHSAEAVLRSAEDSVRTHFKALSVTCALVDGVAGQALTQLSVGARLVVIGSHESPSPSALLAGSTTMTVTANSTCPVVAWRGDAMSPTRQPIVVGVDHDRHSRVAITAAFEFADRLGVGVTAVHAWTADGQDDDTTISWRRAENDARQYLSTTLMPWTDLYPSVEVVMIVDSDSPGRVLLHSSPGAQLLVAGSRAGGLEAGVRLGSIGLELLESSPIPLMFCHSADRDD